MDHNKLGLDASLIEAAKAILEGKKWAKLGYKSEHEYHKARYTYASGKKAPAGTSTMAMMIMADKAERESGKKLHEDVEALDEMKHGGYYTQSHILKKIRSGDWEATHGDVEPGRYVDLRHYTGKKITVKVERDPVKEDFEQLDELSKKTLSNYIKKASADVKKLDSDYEKWVDKDTSKLYKGSPFDHTEKTNRRIDGINKARIWHKTAKEDLNLEDYSLEELEDFMMSEDFEQLDELSKDTLKSYIKKASHDAAAKGVHYGVKKAERDEMDRNLNRDMSYSDKDKIHGIMKTTLKDVDAPRQKAAKRLQGISRAVDKLTREQLEEIEALAAKHGLTKE